MINEYERITTRLHHDYEKDRSNKLMTSTGIYMGRMLDIPLQGNVKVMHIICRDDHCRIIAFKIVQKAFLKHK